MKTCYVCGEQKEDSEFYLSKKGNSMKRFRCKECNNKQSNQYLKDLLIEERRALWNKASNKAREAHPERWRARYQLRYAVKVGKVPKLPCEVCGEIKVQGHHDDYSKPLEVHWLCHKHHRATHYPHKYVTN